MKQVRVSPSSISGRGAFALRRITRGQRVMQMSGKRVRGKDFIRLYEAGKMRWDDPFEIGKDRYIVLGRVPLAINHSCNPNCGIRGVNALYALRDIKAGEEITYDYATVVGKEEEGEAPWYMRCKCRAKNCRKRIGNWQTLPEARLRYFMQQRALPNFVLKQMAW